MKSYCRVATCYKSVFWSAVRYLVCAANPSAHSSTTRASFLSVVLLFHGISQTDTKLFFQTEIRYFIFPKIQFAFQKAYLLPMSVQEFHRNSKGCSKNQQFLHGSRQCMHPLLPLPFPGLQCSLQLPNMFFSALQTYLIQSSLYIGYYMYFVWHVFFQNLSIKLKI